MEGELREVADIPGFPKSLPIATYDNFVSYLVCWIHKSGALDTNTITIVVISDR